MTTTEDPALELHLGWWANCANCGISVLVDKGESQGVLEPAEWDQWIRCPCGETLYWGEATETVWDRENRLMAAAREPYADAIQRLLAWCEKQDAISKGESSTTRAIRRELEGKTEGD